MAPLFVAAWSDQCGFSRCVLLRPSTQYIGGSPRTHSDCTKSPLAHSLHRYSLSPHRSPRQRAFGFPQAHDGPTRRSRQPPPAFGLGDGWGAVKAFLVFMAAVSELVRFFRPRRRRSGAPAQPTLISPSLAQPRPGQKTGRFLAGSVNLIEMRLPAIGHRDSHVDRSPSDCFSKQASALIERGEVAGKHGVLARNQKVSQQLSSHWSQRDRNR
jgi:hypothetical protein